VEVSASSTVALAVVKALVDDLDVVVNAAAVVLDATSIRASFDMETIVY